MPKRKRRIVPRQPNVGAILPVVQRMIAIDALLAGDGLVIDVAAEELGVVGRSVRRSLDILRELAGSTVFEIDEAIHGGPGQQLECTQFARRAAVRTLSPPP